jgi:hypothetical protein
MEHIQNCPQREVECEFCLTKMKKLKQKEHYSLCLKFKRFCPVCKKQIENLEISTHNQGSCYETLSKSFLNASQSDEILNTEFIKDHESTKCANSIMEQKIKLLEQTVVSLKEESVKKDQKINDLLQDILKIKTSSIQVNNNSNQANLRSSNVNIGSVGPSVQLLCQNNLHNFEFLRQGVAEICFKCKREISCRFKCKTCKSFFCYKCNLPSEKLKCPSGHSLIKLKRDLPFYCDLCFDFYNEGSTSYCDKECDVDICDKCYRSKDCIIF